MKGYPDRELARVLAAPVRRRILDAVAAADHPVTVAERTAALGSNHDAVRQHLARLTAAGLVSEEVERGRRAGQAAAAGSSDAIDPVDALERHAQRQAFAPRRVEERSHVDLALDTCPFAEVAAADPRTICSLTAASPKDSRIASGARRSTRWSLTTRTKRLCPPSAEDVLNIATAVPRVRDIATDNDVGVLVRRFDRAVIPDELLGPVFNGVGVDWSRHIPELVGYWSRALLGTRTCNGNTISAH